MTDDLTPLQRITRLLAEASGVEKEFIESSDHPYTCRCDKCLDWWVAMGPEDPDDPSYGPFTVEEVEARKAQTND